MNPFFSFLLSGIILALWAPFTPVNAAGPEEGVLVIDRFSGEDAGGLPKGWKVLTFPRIKAHTEYRVESGDGNYYVKAVSNGSASAIYRKVDIDLRRYPVLSWRWKVDRVLLKGDARKKEGDDYAARVYVTFGYGPEGPSYFDRLKSLLVEKLYGAAPPARAINYIWANRLKKGEAVPNPYTDRSMMVAVRSGPDMTGRWVTEQRNVYKDYKRLFGTEPPRVIGLFIMTDTDNTGEHAVACYDDIVFRKASGSPAAR